MHTCTSPLEAPAGFNPFEPTSPFMSLLGPLYQQRGPDDTVVIALRLTDIHTNMHGIAHGGLLSTLADNALGFNVSRAMQQPVVTVHTSIDYFAPVRPDDWLEAHVSVQKRGRQLSFAECRLVVSGQCVLKASAVFSARKKEATG